MTEPTKIRPEDTKPDSNWLMCHLLECAWLIDRTLKMARHYEEDRFKGIDAEYLIKPLINDMMPLAEKAANELMEDEDGLQKALGIERLDWDSYGSKGGAS